MATFQTLQQNVAADLDDASNNRFALARIKRELNAARRDLISRSKILRKQSTALSGAATTPTYAFYTLPTDFLTLDESEQGGVYDNGRRIYPISLGCLGDNWASQTSSQPSNYIKPTGGVPTELQLWPYSTTALTNLTLWYAYLPADMSGNSDPTLLSPEFDEALEARAKARLLRVGEDAEKALAVAYEQDYEAKVLQAINKAAQGASSQGAYVRYQHV